MSVDSSVYDACSMASSMNYNNITSERKGKKISGSICSLQFGVDEAENYEDHGNIRIKCDLLQYLYVSRCSTDISAVYSDPVATQEVFQKNEDLNLGERMDEVEEPNEATEEMKEEAVSREFDLSKNNFDSEVNVVENKGTYKENATTTLPTYVSSDKATIHVSLASPFIDVINHGWLNKQTS